jgi:hypothetical protein
LCRFLPGKITALRHQIQVISPHRHVSKRDAVDIDTNSLGALLFAEQQ